MTAITFNLDKSLVDFVKSFAKENNITQREVVQIGLEKIRHEKKRKEIIAESKAIWADKELREECLWLANAGLEDYNNNLKKIDNGTY